MLFYVVLGLLLITSIVVVVGLSIFQRHFEKTLSPEQRAKEKAKLEEDMRIW